MTAYPTQPTGDNSIDLINIFASNSTSKIIMSESELLEGYNNDGETSTPLTSTPDGNKFNYFWYQVHNTLTWVVNYAKALFDNKLELSGGTMTGALAMVANKITSSYVPIANTDLTNKLYVDTAVNGAWLLTEIKELAYPIIPTLPSGMEVCECDGRALSRTTYSALFAIMGITHGSGDGATTFNIPDKRGVVTRGWDNGRGLDVGRVFGSYQNSGIPNLSGTFQIGGAACTPDGTLFSVDTTASTAGAYDTYGVQYRTKFDASKKSSEYKNISETRVKNTTGYYVMRIK